jgi:hypothetical protein
VSDATLRAAQSGDAQQFGVALAADGAKVVLFADAAGVAGATVAPPAEGPHTVENAIRAFAARSGAPGSLTDKGGVFMGAASPAHCAMDVLSRPVRDWQFSGSFRDFERAFDRHVHGLGQMAEGETLGPMPPSGSPMLGPVSTSVRVGTARDVWLSALAQLDGVLVIFRELRDESGRLQCVRETYVRDATITTFIGFSRNPRLFTRRAER